MPGTGRDVIVAGVDGSESASNAALWAGAEAQLRTADLHLVHGFTVPLTDFVGPSTGDAGLFITAPEIYNVLRDTATQILAAARDAVAAAYPGLMITTALTDQPAVPTLKAASEGALITVVGSHGAQHLTGSRLGSVAARISGHAHSPVIVVRADPVTGTVRGDGPVVVGWDDSSSSVAALAFAFAEAALRQVPVMAIHTWDDAALDGLLGAHPGVADRREISERKRRSLATQLVEWRQRYPNVQVHLLVLRGYPAGELLGYCRNPVESDKPALLVVGSRGRGGFTGMLLGSTSQALIAHAPCPVAVVRVLPDGHEGLIRRPLVTT